MRSATLFAPLISLILVLSGCASIVSKSDWPVTINSEPSGASVVITDSTGRTVYTGTTPTTVTLSSDGGFFQGESYRLRFEKKGHTARVYQLEAKVNGWYFGNFVFGGPLGLLVVDPLTGAMYRLEENVDVTLLPDLSQGAQLPTLKIVSLAEVDTSLRERLVPLAIN